MGILRVVKHSMRNYMILITGNPQSRKSTMAIRLAHDIQPDWDMTKQMAILKGEDYITALMNIDLHRGDVVVLDEIQSGLGHREWFSFINKALNLIMQTHGYRGLVVIVTTPFAKYVDSDTKALFNMWIKMNDAKPDIRADACMEFVTYTLEQQEFINDRDKKVNILTIRPVDLHTQKVIRSMILRWPPDEVMQTYYAWANGMKAELTAGLSSEARRITDKETRAMFDGEAEADKLIARLEAGERGFIKQVGGAGQGGRAYVNVNAIRNELKVGMARARDVKLALETKLGARLNDFVS